MGRRRERDGEGHHSCRSRNKDTKKSSNKKVRNDARPTIYPRPPMGITPSASPGSPRSSSSNSTGTSERLLGERDSPRSRKRKRRHDGGRAAEDDATSSSGGREGSVVTEKRTTSKARKNERGMADVPDKKREKKRQKKREREDRKRRGVGEEKVKKHSKRPREKTKLLLLPSSRAQTAPGGSSTSNNSTDGSARARNRTLARRPSPEDALGTVNHRARSHPPVVKMGTDRAALLPPLSEPAGSSQGSPAASCRKARAKAMVPMRPEEFTAQQKVIREVFDEDTGRWRLVRGTGEIIERIVSRREQHAIQQHASRGGWDHKALSGAAVMPSGSSLGGR